MFRQAEQTPHPINPHSSRIRNGASGTMRSKSSYLADTCLGQAATERETGYGKNRTRLSAARNDRRRGMVRVLYLRLRPEPERSTRRRIDRPDYGPVFRLARPRSLDPRCPPFGGLGSSWVRSLI